MPAVRHLVDIVHKYIRIYLYSAGAIRSMAYAIAKKAAADVLRQMPYSTGQLTPGNGLRHYGWILAGRRASVNVGWRDAEGHLGATASIFSSFG